VDLRDGSWAVNLMVLTDLYGELMLSDVSRETLVDGGLVAALGLRSH